MPVTTVVPELFPVIGCDQQDPARLVPGREVAAGRGLENETKEPENFLEHAIHVVDLRVVGRHAVATGIPDDFVATARNR